METQKSHTKLTLLGLFLLGVFLDSSLPVSIYESLKKAWAPSPGTVVNKSNKKIVASPTNIGETSKKSPEDVDGHGTQPPSEGPSPTNLNKEVDASQPRAEEPTTQHTGPFQEEGKPRAEESHEAKVFILFEKLGEALIIAALLAVVVDEAVKKALVAEIVRDVLDFAVGFQLPEEVKEQVKFILRKPFVRRRFFIHYKLEVVSEVPDATRNSTSIRRKRYRRKKTTKDDIAVVKAPASERYLQVTSTTQYEVENLTDTESIYLFRSSTEVYHCQGAPENRLVLMDVPSLGITKEGEQLEQITKNEGPYKKATLPIPIGPSRHGPVLLRTVRIQCYPLEYTMVLDILEPPCIGLKIAVECDFSINANVTFGVPGEITYSQEHGTEVWSHPGVHLPGSHFRLSWKAQPPNTFRGSEEDVL